ncbi:BMC domain-containing protein [Saliterribacillus persicus]|uniref:BMC domain-containing protein n=1 Tax=Saliterribacillus persicus TaxID=930114 RepID=A0A368Y106_9BACI|nr:BMC domain-containing protein [Saliterribacillus persicus]RCW71934.1 BMC domain-containing protein [Saliterribacillus persicus]
MYRSIGLIEVAGMTTAISSVDAMVKGAYVEVVNIERIGSGLITIIISGDLASVQAAVEVGIEAASSHGEVFGFKVIPRPSESLYQLYDPEQAGENNE